MAEALKDSYIETHDQENFFYEGSEKELNKARVSLRTRFYGGDKKCVITMKVPCKHSICDSCRLKACPTSSACRKLISNLVAQRCHVNCGPYNMLSRMADIPYQDDLACSSQTAHPSLF